MRTKHKTFPLILLLSLALLLTASYGIRADTPIRGGRLDYGMRVLPAHLDPHYIQSRPSGRNNRNPLFENLIKMDAEGYFHPQLATSWDADESGMVFTFHVREGVYFHDETPFTAEAAAFNLKRASGEGTAVSEELRMITEIEVVDEYILKVYLDEPSAAFLNYMASTPGYMVSPAAVEKYGDDFGYHPVGTGPFMFKDWPHESLIRLEKFPRYWDIGVDGEPLPYIHELHIHIITDDAVKFVNLRTGELDIVDSILPRDVGVADNIENIVAKESNRGVAYLLNFNVSPGSQEISPFKDNQALRQAVAYAIDNQTLLEAVLEGQGHLSPTVLREGIWAYDEELSHYPYDPEKAKEKLIEAGYPDGIDVKIAVIDRQPDVEIVEWMETYLRDVDIRTEIQVMERLAWIDHTRGRHHQMAFQQTGQPRPDPDFTLRFCLHPESLGNYSGWHHEGVIELLDAGIRELDMDKRKEIYSEIQRLYVEEAPQIPIFQRTHYYAKSTALFNESWDAFGIFDFREAWLGE